VQSALHLVGVYTTVEGTRMLPSTKGSGSGGTGSSSTDLWGAIVVIAGLVVVVGVFFGALTHFTDSKDVVAVVGAITGVVGTIVTAFFGIHATAKAGSDATQTVKDAHDKAIAAAAYVPPEKAAEFVDKLGISPH
jgi:UPF0716 family protein affecting phage T7 exclusion